VKAFFTTLDRIITEAEAQYKSTKGIEPEHKMAAAFLLHAISASYGCA